MPKKLPSKWLFDFPEGYRCRFINSTTEREVLHSHEYYEIFLTLTNDIEHIINDSQETLEIGSLVFIRPSDVHLYKKEAHPYKFINFAFSVELADEVFQFLGQELDIAKMLKCTMPPSVILSKSELKKGRGLFNHINCIPSEDIQQKRLQAKFILTTLFIKYLSRFTDYDTKQMIPTWLTYAYEQMKFHENFQIGVPAMIKLSNKTYEHLSRSINKYYGITATEYVNQLRLNYAANMITNTNFSLTDIGFEAGFNSSSYFATCFKKYYDMTPTEYRKLSQNKK